MSTPRERVIGTLTAALLVVTVLVSAKLDAVETQAVEEFFSSVDATLVQSWTALWNRDAGTVELKVAGTDGSWSAVPDLAGKHVGAVAFSPAVASDRTILAGADDGIYRSRDGGITWARTLATNDAVTGIAVSPSFAGDGTAFAVTNGSGLWRTLDSGTSWQQLDANANGIGVALSPAFASDRTAFVAAFDRILRSTDAGGTWTDLTIGIPESVRVHGDLRAIAVDQQYATNRTVYVAALGIGVYRSTDAGVTWASANPATVAVPYVTAITTGTTGRVAAAYLSGVYESADGGATWSAVYTGDDAQAVAYAPDGSLLIARLTGVERARNGNATAIASGWSGGAAVALDIAPTYPASGSVLGGQEDGARMVRIGFASPGVAQSAAGIDRTPHRIASAIVTPTATIPTGTTITYEVSVADGDAKWEGPLTPGDAWTFSAQGSTLRWRATLTSADGIASPSLDAITIRYETDDSLNAPTPAPPIPTAAAIRWAFTNAPADATGFEVRLPSGAVVGSVDDRSATAVEERDLPPGTEHCGRRVYTVRGEERSAGSTPLACAVTLAAIPPAPTASVASSSSVQLRFAAGAGNPTDVTYAIRETASERSLNADGAFVDAAVWQSFAAWGNGSVTVTGLTPDTAYAFCVVARNRALARSACSPEVAVRVAPTITEVGAVTLSVRTTLPRPTIGSGGTIPIRVDITQVGAGMVEGVVLRVPFPANARYVLGSLALGGVPLTDVGDGDAGDTGITAPDAATVRLGSFIIGERRTVTLVFATDAASGATVTVAPTASYRPQADRERETVAASPLAIAVVEADAAPHVPEQPEALRPETPGAPLDGVEPAAAGVTLELLAPTDGVVVATNAAVAIRGRATVGADVRVGLDGRDFWIVTAGADGAFSFSLPPLSEGTHRIAATLGAESRSVQLTAVVPPAEALVLTAPLGGAVTNAETIIVSGRGPPNLAVTAALDGTDAATVTAAEHGGFTTVLPGPIAEGAHDVHIRATTASGFVLTSSAAFTVDRTPPTAPAVQELRIADRQVSATRDGAFDTTLELRGTIPAEEFSAIEALLLTVTSDPVTLAFRPAEPTWSYRITLPLEPGLHTARIAARDRAGNVSFLPDSLSFLVPHAACGDGADNDGDGATDFPSDPDCRSAFDFNEATEGAIARAVTVVGTATVASAKAVAAATTVAAVATARTAEQAATVVQEQVLDNPVVEVTTERVVAPAVVVAVATNTATAVHGFQLLAYGQYFLGLLAAPGRLLARRKRKAWGTVYGSLTKRPVDLATVRLLDVTTGKILQTEVTDHLGRYSFIVKEAGTYRMEARHQQYTFPSKLLQGRTEDRAFVDLHFGAAIIVPEGGGFITKNIPLDAKAEEVVPATDRRVIRQHYGRIASGLVSDGGLVLSIASFAISPRLAIGVILGVNLVAYVLFRRLARRARAPRSWGAVSDARSRSPIRLAVVRLFDEEFHKLLETAATDRYGRYRFLVGKSEYYVVAQKPGYDPAKSSTLDLTKEEGIVGVDLKLKPVAKH